MQKINFEFFRVAPVLMFFLSISFALAFKSIAWTFMFIGLTLNGILWGILTPYLSKKYPNASERPNRSQCYFLYKKDPVSAGGLPSGHSQSAAFFSTWLVFLALHYRFNNPTLIVTFIIALWLTIGMMISRVHDYQCHTTLQATTGSMIGIITAVILWPIYLLVLQNIH